MRPFALLFLAVSVDAGPSCEKCNARDYKIVVAFENHSSYELVRARVNDELLEGPVPPGAQSATTEKLFRSFEAKRLDYELLLAKPAGTADGPRIVMPAEGPFPDELVKDRLMVIELTDANLRTRCTGMTRETYESISFPGVEITPWDQVPCP